MYNHSMKQVISKLLALVAMVAIATPASAMTTPMLVLNGGAGATSGGASTQHTGCYNFSAGINSFQPVSYAPMPVAGTFHDLYVSVDSTISSGSYTITLMKNGSVTALTTTVDSGTPTNSDAVNSVSFNVNDQCAIRVAPAGSATAIPAGMLKIGMAFTDSGGHHQPLLFRSGINTTQNTYFIPGSNSNDSTTESGSSVIFPTSGTLSNFYLQTYSGGTPGAGKSVTFAIRVNSATSTVTCTMSDSDTTCSDTSNSVSVAKGDRVSIVAAPTGTPTSIIPQGGIRFTPTIPGESVLLGKAVSFLSATEIRYLYPGATTNGQQAVEALTTAVAPVAFTVRDLFVDYVSAQGSGNSRSVVFRQNAATTTVSATVSGTSQLQATSTDSVGVSIGDRVTFATEPISSPTGSSFRYSAVMYIAPPVAPSASLPYRLYNLGTMLLNRGSLILR